MEAINNIFTLHLPALIEKKMEQDRLSFLPGQSKSTFIVTIITNYYDLYDAKYQDISVVLKNAIKQEDNAKNIPDYAYSSIIWKVYEHMEKGQLTSNKKAEKKARINIRLNSQNNEKLIYILEKAPLGANQSSYLSSILTSYLNLPKQERERIAFKDTVAKIECALANQCKLRFSTKNGKYIVNPIGIYNSNEELYNYLVYELDPDEKHMERRIRQVHIRNMRFVDFRLREKRVLSENYQKKVEQMLNNGVQFGYGNEVVYKVQLTKAGIQQYKNSYLEQPKPLNEDFEETGILCLNCSAFQLERYFAPFYNNAKILEPEEEADKIMKKLEMTYLQYTSAKE